MNIIDVLLESSYGVLTRTGARKERVENAKNVGVLSQQGDMGEFVKILQASTKLTKQSDDILFAVVTERTDWRYDFGEACFRKSTVLQPTFNPRYDSSFIENVLYTNSYHNSLSLVENIVKKYESAQIQTYIHTDYLLQPLYERYLPGEEHKFQRLYIYKRIPHDELSGYNLAYYEKATTCDDENVPNGYAVFLKKSGGSHNQGTVAQLVDAPPLPKHKFLNNQIVAGTTESVYNRNVSNFIPLRTQEGNIVTVTTNLPFSVNPGAHGYEFVVNPDGTTNPPIL